MLPSEPRETELWIPVHLNTQHQTETAVKYYSHRHCWFTRCTYSLISCHFCMLAWFLSHLTEDHHAPDLTAPPVGCQSLLNLLCTQNKHCCSHIECIYMHDLQWIYRNRQSLQPLKFALIFVSGKGHGKQNQMETFCILHWFYFTSKSL